MVFHLDVPRLAELDLGSQRDVPAIFAIFARLSSSDTEGSVEDPEKGPHHYESNDERPQHGIGNRTMKESVI
jgi:hypothetical protein